MGLTPLSSGTGGSAWIAVAVSVGLQCIEMLFKIRCRAKVFNQRAEAGNHMDWQTVAPTNLRDCRLALVRNDLFTVQCNNHSCCLGAGRFDDVHRLTDSGTCSDHIIDDDNPAGELCTDNGAAFTMVLNLFSVVGKGYVAPILVV